MVWGDFQGKNKSREIRMGRNRRKAVDFVEQFYDIELGRFWAEINGPVLMEGGSPAHRSNDPMKRRD